MNFASPPGGGQSENAQSDAPGGGAIDPSCAITFLAANPWKRLTKSHSFDTAKAAVVTESFSRAKTFNVWEQRVHNLGQLARLLSDASTHPSVCIIRGRPIGGGPLKKVRRLLHARATEPDGAATIESVARRWMAIDIDDAECPPMIDPIHDPEEAADHIIAQLPEELDGVSFIWNITASAGIKKRGINLRLFFWLDKPLATEELKIWFADCDVDPAVFNPDEPIYIGSPLIEGMTDPVPRRWGMWRGHSDEVEVPAITRPDRPARLGSGSPTGGAGYDYYRSQIGDQEGGDGFYKPIKGAIGAYFARHGSAGNAASLRDDLETAIRERAGTRDSGYIEARIRDLDRWIEWTRQRQLETENERSKQGFERAAEAASTAAEIVEPSWPMPTATAREAANASEEAIAEFMRKVRKGCPDGGEPVQIGVAGEMSSGKTRAYTRHGLAELIATDKDSRLHIFLPAHAQTADVARRFNDFDAAAEDIAHLFNEATERKIAHVWLGAEQPNPDNPEEQMCPIHESAAEVIKAGGHIRNVCSKPVPDGAEANFVDADGKGWQLCKRHPSVAGEAMCGRQRLFLAAADPRNRVWVHPQVMLQYQIPEQFGSLKPSAVVIDEAPWNGHIKGCGETPYKLSADALGKTYDIPPAAGKAPDPLDAWLFNSACALAFKALQGRGDGRLLASEFLAAYRELSTAFPVRPHNREELHPFSDTVLRGLIAGRFQRASRLAWRMKLDPTPAIVPGFKPAEAEQKMKRFVEHNSLVTKLARFFELAAKTMTARSDVSAHLEMKTEEISTPAGPVDIEHIHMYWADDIANSWRSVPVLYLDGTLQPERAKRYLPRLNVTSDVKAATPAAVYRRQVHDQAIAHGMIKPDPKASAKNRKTQENNALAAARVLEVKAAQFAGRGAHVDAIGARIDGLAVMPLATEEFIRREAPLPANISLAHHNNLRGVNLYAGVGYLAIVSRPSAPPSVAEKMAWAESGEVGQSIEPVVNGARIETKYPKRKCGRLMRDGTGRAAWQEYHPDPWVEMIRWSITEGELLQNEARARAMWRTSDRPLLVDIITNVPLSLPVDELITWDEWMAEGSPLELLRARGTDLGSDRGVAGLAARLLPDAFRNQQAFWNRNRTSMDTDVLSDDKSVTETASTCISPIRELSIGEMQVEPVFATLFSPTPISEAHRQLFAQCSIRVEGERYGVELGRDLTHWPPKESLQTALDASIEREIAGLSKKYGADLDRLKGATDALNARRTKLDKFELVSLPYQEAVDAVDNLFVGDVTGKKDDSTRDKRDAFIAAVIRLFIFDAAIAELPKAPGFTLPTYSWWQPTPPRGGAAPMSPLETAAARGFGTDNPEVLAAAYPDLFTLEAAKSAIRRAKGADQPIPDGHFEGEFRTVAPGGRAPKWSYFHYNPTSHPHIYKLIARCLWVPLSELQFSGPAADVIEKARAAEDARPKPPGTFRLEPRSGARANGIRGPKRMQAPPWPSVAVTSRAIAAHVARLRRDRRQPIPPGALIRVRIVAGDGSAVVTWYDARTGAIVAPRSPPPAAAAS